MGTLIQVSCTTCGEIDTQVDGVMMMGYLARCSRCGDTELVERFRVDVPSDNEDRLNRRVCELAGTCSCGGRYAPDAPIRCLACRSTAVELAEIGHAD